MIFLTPQELLMPIKDWVWQGTIIGELKAETSSIYRQYKRECETWEYEELEAGMKNARKFYEKIWREDLVTYRTPQSRIA